MYDMITNVQPCGVYVYFSSDFSVFHNNNSERKQNCSVDSQTFTKVWKPILWQTFCADRLVNLSSSQYPTNVTTNCEHNFNNVLFKVAAKTCDNVKSLIIWNALLSHRSYKLSNTIFKWSKQLPLLAEFSVITFRSARANYQLAKSRNKLYSLIWLRER